MISKIKKYFIYVLSFLCLISIFLASAVMIDVKATTNSEIISLIDGAWCRAEEEFSGLKFGATVNMEKFSTLRENNSGTTFTVGMAIVPTSYIEGNDYTLNGITENGTRTIQQKDVESMPNTKTGELEFFGTMTKIKDANYTRNFSAIAYIKADKLTTDFTEFDGSYYQYASYSVDKNSRSVYQVAKADMKDDAFGENEEFVQNIIKEYVDSVADIEIKEGNASMLNDIPN